MTDFGFWYPVEYVSEVVAILELSRFCFWPNAGGLNEQDSHLIDDVRTWMRLKRRLKYEYDAGIWREDGRSMGGRNPLDARGGRINSTI